MPLFTLILIIALAILLFYAIRQSGRRSNTPPDEDSAAERRTLANNGVRGAQDDERNDRLASMFGGDLGEYQKEETELAVRVASEKFGRELDFSHRSIGDVEAILGGAHDYTRLGDAKDTDNLAEWAAMFGCYLASVIQRQTGEGQLVRDPEHNAEDGYAFLWRGHTLLLHAWCHKRIFEGPGFDVAQQYRDEVLEHIYGSR